MNERKTEDILEKRLRNFGYYKEDSGISVEKQQSDSPAIRKFLANASKKGNGVGYPEFIIHSTTTPDFIIVIECKASPGKHSSKTLDQYADYAVDGALLYASFLSRQFDVLAIAASGESEAEFHLSHYLHLKNTPKAIEFAGDNILPFKDYYNEFLKSGVKFKQDYDALLDYSRKLNSALQAKKIKEAHRGFLISGILIALQNVAFKKSFRSHTKAQHLADNLLATIESEFESADLPQDRIMNLKQAFSFIGTAPGLVNDKAFFVELLIGP